MLKQPLNSDIPATLCNRHFHTPNCMQTILNNPDVVDIHLENCPPSLMEPTINYTKASC